MGCRERGELPLPGGPSCAHLPKRSVANRESRYPPPAKRWGGWRGAEHRAGWGVEKLRVESGPPPLTPPRRADARGEGNPGASTVWPRSRVAPSLSRWEREQAGSKPATWVTE